MTSDNDNKPPSIPPYERISTTTDAKGEPVKWSNASADSSEAPSSTSFSQRVTGAISAISHAIKDAWRGLRGGRHGE